MIKENWAFWILLILFVFNCIDMFFKVCGLKRSYSWDGNFADKIAGVFVYLIYGFILAVALGWLW